MARTKNTAKKSNGGSAPRVLLTTSRTGKTGTSGVDAQRRKALTASKVTTVGGGDLEKRNAHHKALTAAKATLPMGGGDLDKLGGHNELPPELETKVLQEDVLFRCICCHIKMEQGGAYFGFYNANGLPALDRFLPINMAGSPLEFAHSFLKPYYTGDGIKYLDVYYDIGSDAKAAPYCSKVRNIIKGLKNSFVWERVVISISTHTDEDFGDPFIGYEDGDTNNYLSTLVDDFLEIILQPWQTIIDHTQESYLWMLCCSSLVNNSDSFHGLQEAVVQHKLTGTITFNAPCFQPSFALHLLISFTERVLIGWCPLRLAFKDMLAQSCDLGRHSDIFLLTVEEGALTCSRFAWANLEAVLDEHKIAYVSTKGNATKRATILKSIKDTIVQTDQAKDPSTMLPDNNLRKAICTYYLRFLEDDEDHNLEEKIIQGGHKLMSGPDIVTVDMVKDHKDDKPLDAAAFRTEFSPFDVAQKLFKEEIGEYDKKHHNTSDLRSMGTRTKLVRSWYNALSPAVLEELRLVAEKWNQEGPHSDAKDSWESCPRKVKKTFTLASKDNKKWAGDSQDRLADWLNEAKYAAIDPEDESDEDDEKVPDLTVHVDDEGYPCLPTGFESLILKNQQKVVRKVFQKVYAVISNNPRAAVPWGHITQDPDHYLDMDCISQNVVIKNPSHLQKEAISMIFSLWKYHANHNEPVVQFVGYKEGDFYDSLAKKGDDEVLKKAPQANLSSDEEEDLAIHASHTPSLSNSCPKFHIGGDIVSYLQSLSILPSYRCLLATVQKLSKTHTPDPKGKARKQHLPVWASWTWSEAYLSQNMHDNFQSSFLALEELENYTIKSCGWGMIVVLGLGLLLRECSRAQEYEADEAGDHVPEYLGNSVLGIQAGEKIEEAITRIQVKVDAMLPGDNEKQMTVREEVHMRRLENKRQVKARREAEQARVAEEKRVDEEAWVAEEKKVVEEKRVAEVSRMAEEKRVAEEAQIVEASRMAEERAATSKKASNTNTGGKGKGKRPATDVNNSIMKKCVGPSLPLSSTWVTADVQEAFNVAFETELTLQAELMATSLVTRRSNAYLCNLGLDLLILQAKIHRAQAEIALYTLAIENAPRFNLSDNSSSMSPDHTIPRPLLEEVHHYDIDDAANEDCEDYEDYEDCDDHEDHEIW
ncbi:hypothetical protein F4604DRAFT_1934773 [Suillus subluteus]|nr:hypothetical protein F4604DRAFT_1934773 [Suillus subluteus]